MSRKVSSIETERWVVSWAWGGNRKWVQMDTSDLSITGLRWWSRKSVKILFKKVLYVELDFMVYELYLSEAANDTPHRGEFIPWIQGDSEWGTRQTQHSPVCNRHPASAPQHVASMPLLEHLSPQGGSGFQFYDSVYKAWHILGVGKRRMGGGNGWLRMKERSIIAKPVNNPCVWGKCRFSAGFILLVTLISNKKHFKN